MPHEKVRLNRTSGEDAGMHDLREFSQMQVAGACVLRCACGCQKDSFPNVLIINMKKARDKARGEMRATGDEPGDCSGKSLPALYDRRTCTPRQYGGEKKPMLVV